MFEGIALKDVKKKQYKATIGAPVEPRKFCQKRLTDTQINHFLDFSIVVLCKMMQVVQELSNFPQVEKQKYWMLLELYIKLNQFICILVHVSKMESYTQEDGCPSEHTLENTLKNWPASQRKGLAGLDVVSDGSDSFDRRIKICKRLENKSCDELVKELAEGRR